MAKNRGKSLEEYLDVLHRQYRAQGIAKIHKVDPPTRTVAVGKGKTRTFYLPNPWLDFAGVWTAKGNRALVFEAKHTEEPTLRIERSGGITEAQWLNLRDWERAGAATFILWEHRGIIKVITTAMVEAALEDKGRMSLQWNQAITAPRNDFLAVAQHLT